MEYNFKFVTFCKYLDSNILFIDLSDIPLNFNVFKFESDELFYNSNSPSYFQKLNFKCSEFGK